MTIVELDRLAYHCEHLAHRLFNTSTTTTLAGVACDINGHRVNTGPNEAANAHLRCND